MLLKNNYIKTLFILLSVGIAAASISSAAEIFVSQQRGYLEFRKVKLKQDKKGARLVGKLYSKSYKRVKLGSHMHIYIYDAEGTRIEEIFNSTERQVFRQKDRDKRKRGYIFPDHIIRLKSDFAEIALVKIYVYGAKHYEHEAHDD